MTHRSPTSRTIEVDALARVEGEGAMHVQIRDGAVADVQLKIYEPPRFFEAFLRGRALHRAAGHHRPDLRDLPGGVPDERVPGDRGRLRGRPSTGRSATCAGCSTAASGSRATPCTSTCCTPPTSSATTERIALAADHRAVVERGLALKKAGNASGAARRPGHPPGQRPGRRLLPGADAAGAGAAARSPASRRATRPWRRSAGSPASTSPTSSTATSCVALVAQTSTPYRVAASVRAAASTSAPPSSTSTS